MALPDSYRDINELLAEAKYFLIEELTDSCQQALAKKERDAEPICRVPLITSQKEEQLLIMATAKVSLLCICLTESFLIIHSNELTVVKELINNYNIIFSLLLSY